ncbi:hypothetical protein Glove_363g23 [Diversispora epigaea]|uniref:Uncharacterized protein n=1 Tax=Diversispora epigaea TaxID=1348612 RepID=A0A397HE05_9GLOM|nr:hypothetical protein Glove_363g23 [Diversispora epigaea]
MKIISRKVENLSDEFDWSFNNAHSTPNTKNPRPGNDNEKSSSEFPPPSDVGFKDDVKLKFDFTNIEKELLQELTNEVLFLIIVLNSPCLYPAYIFIIQEWQMVTRKNPYTITDPVLPIEVLPL